MQNLVDSDQSSTANADSHKKGNRAEAGIGRPDLAAASIAAMSAAVITAIFTAGDAHPTIHAVLLNDGAKDDAEPPPIKENYVTEQLLRPSKALISALTAVSLQVAAAHEFNSQKDTKG